jgi:hypothetical protein
VGCCVLGSVAERVPEATSRARKVPKAIRFPVVTSSSGGRTRRPRTAPCGWHAGGRRAGRGPSSIGSENRSKIERVGAGWCRRGGAHSSRNFGTPSRAALPGAVGKIVRTSNELRRSSENSRGLRRREPEVPAPRSS